MWVLVLMIVLFSILCAWDIIAQSGKQQYVIKQRRDRRGRFARGSVRVPLNLR